MFKFLILLLLTSTSLFAEVTAVVDMNMIMQQSEAIKDLNEQLENKKSKLAQELNTREESLKKADKTLSEERDILSEEAFKRKANEFQEQVMFEQKDAQAKANKLEQSYLSTLEKINNKIREIIMEKSKSLNIDLVLPKSHVLFSSESVADISDSVLTKLNKELSKVTMNENDKI